MKNKSNLHVYYEMENFHEDVYAPYYQFIDQADYDKGDFDVARYQFDTREEAYSALYTWAVEQGAKIEAFEQKQLDGYASAIV